MNIPIPPGQARSFAALDNSREPCRKGSACDECHGDRAETLTLVVPAPRCGYSTPPGEGERVLVRIPSEIAPSMGRRHDAGCPVGSHCEDPWCHHDGSCTCPTENWPALVVSSREHPADHPEGAPVWVLQVARVSA